MEQLNIKLEAFEGPLDLLYHLIEKNEIDIYDIPISQLTDQYMEYLTLLQMRNMDSMSEFMLMAATLLEIKSKMLLPRPKKDDEENIDPRMELVNKLIEYKRFKKIVEEFKELGGVAERYLCKQPETELLAELYREREESREEIVSRLMSDVSPEALYELFEQVLMRRELKTDHIRSGFDSVARDLFTIDEKIDFIRDILALSRRVEFFELFRQDVTRMEKVVTFLALLELIRAGDVKIEQDLLFSEIYISISEEGSV